MIAVEQESVFRECCQLCQLDFLLAQVVVTPANVVTPSLQQKESSTVSNHNIHSIELRNWIDNVRSQRGDIGNWTTIRLFGTAQQ